MDTSTKPYCSPFVTGRWFCPLRKDQMGHELPWNWQGLQFCVVSLPQTYPNVNYDEEHQKSKCFKITLFPTLPTAEERKNSYPKARVYTCQIHCSPKPSKAGKKKEQRSESSGLPPGDVSILRSPPAVSDTVRNGVRSPAVRGVERGVVRAGEGFSRHPGGAQVLGVGVAAPVALLFLGAPSPAVLKENALRGRYRGKRRFTESRQSGF
jgi:hypothetical protein